MREEIMLNHEWKAGLESAVKPRVTIITPVYNRQDVLPRAMDSVMRQTIKDFEYIIVNDGSTQDLDNIVLPFMAKAGFPVMYIKKENGGVHTARNAGIRQARGEMVAMMDSDDEFTDDAISNLIREWDGISADAKGGYIGIKFKVKDQSGRVIGEFFPDGINDLPYEEAKQIYDRINVGAEHYGFRRADILKENLWPEPEGITFVSESIVWDIVEKKYKNYYSNFIPRVYHTEDQDSYIRSPKRNLQHVKNWHWNCCYKLNRPQTYAGGV